MSTLTAAYKKVKGVKDTKFTIDRLQHYNLSLQIGPNDLTLAVNDTKKNRCLILEDYIFQNVPDQAARFEVLRRIFDEHHLLMAGFWHSVRLSLKTKQFAMVPNGLFKPDYVADYLAVNAAFDPATESLHYYKHINAKAVNVFAANKALVQLVQGFYPNLPLQLVHQGSALIEAVLNYHDHSHEKSMFVHVDRFAMHLVVTQNRQLLYYNQFAIKKFDDYLKYIFTVFKALEMDPNRNKVLLWGFIKPESAHYKAFYEYIKNLTLGQRPNFLNFGFQFDELMEHAYLDLLGIYLCE